MAIITCETSIRRSIALVQAKGKGLDTLIGKTAIEALAHGQIHGDFSLLGALIRAMPKGSRVKSLQGWISDVAPLTFAKDGKVSVDRTKIKSGQFPADRSLWDVEALTRSDWTDWKPAGAGDLEFTEEQILQYLGKVAEGKRKGATEQAMDSATLALKVLTDARDAREAARKDRILAESAARVQAEQDARNEELNALREALAAAEARLTATTARKGRKLAVAA